MPWNAQPGSAGSTEISDTAANVPVALVSAAAP
jgi:hypothetical protein